MSSSRKSASLHRYVWLNTSGSTYALVLIVTACVIVYRKKAQVPSDPDVDRPAYVRAACAGFMQACFGVSWISLGPTASCVLPFYILSHTCLSAVNQPGRRTRVALLLAGILLAATAFRPLFQALVSHNSSAAASAPFLVGSVLAIMSHVCPFYAQDASLSVGIGAKTQLIESAAAFFASVVLLPALSTKAWLFPAQTWLESLGWTKSSSKTMLSSTSIEGSLAVMSAARILVSHFVRPSKLPRTDETSHLPTLFVILACLRASFFLAPLDRLSPLVQISSGVLVTGIVHLVAQSLRRPRQGFESASTDSTELTERWPSKLLRYPSATTFALCPLAISMAWHCNSVLNPTASSEMPLFYRNDTTTRHHFSLVDPDIQSTFDAFEVSWPPSDNQVGSTEFSIMIYSDVCIEKSASRDQRGQFWLLGSLDADKLSSVSDMGEKAEELWWSNWQHGGESSRGTIGIKHVEQLEASTVVWQEGVTLALTKLEHGMHPAAWMRPLFTLASATINAPAVFASAGLTSRKLFDRVQLLEERLKPNEWGLFVLSSALQVVRRALAAFEGRPPLSVTSGFNETAAEELLKDSTSYAAAPAPSFTCYKTLVKVTELREYFRNQADANAYRWTAYSMLPEASKLLRQDNATRAVKAVLLLRDRPLWNSKDVEQVMANAGLQVSVVQVDASMDYRDQVLTFATADIVVSVHGSHLNNQIFMRPTASLIEIYPYLYYEPEEGRLAVRTGIHHIELLDSSYPPVSLLEDINDRTLELYNRCKTLSASHPTLEECMNDFHCRGAHRMLGVYANLTSVEAALKDSKQFVIDGRKSLVA